MKWKKSKTIYWVKRAVKKLENPCSVREEPYYVTRPNLESELKSAIRTMCENISRTYYVIIGSRETGKRRFSSKVEMEAARQVFKM